MKPGKKIYFASDFHLGIPDHEQSLQREKRIVRWLDQIKHDCETLFLLGDVFDFWFEYKEVVPRGYVRLLGKLAELSDSGIKIHYFTGNHDMWMSDYLTTELNLTLHKKPFVTTIAGKVFYLAHGDGLGPGDKGYKFLKKVFSNPLSQWLFARLHPNLGISLANYWSGKSRNAQQEIFLGENKEWLIIFCKNLLRHRNFDYLIFGHRHLALDIPVTPTSRYINLGDWITFNTYAVFDLEKLELKEFKE